MKLMSETATQVWQNCLRVIEDNINKQSYQTWFEPIKAIKLENSVLTIQVPSQFFYEWLEEHYIQLLKKVIKNELGANGRLEYSIVMDSNYPSHKQPYAIKVPTSNRSDVKNPSVAMPVNINQNNTKEIPNPFVIPGLKKINVHSQLISSYSFDNFVEGDCNRLARSAGYAVASKPGKTSFNPLFIYSDVGLGKTHLGHAIGLQVKSNFPDKTVLYVSTEQFTQQFIEAVRNNNTNDFIHFYQMIDTLIMDDIQFLGGKEKTQDVFFHIFNHLHQHDKQIVITSDKSPVDMTGLEPRLLSRFKWGLAADLQVPDLETRIAILQKHLYRDGIEMPNEVIEHIAYSISSNIRELEGALISIIAQASLNKKEITLDLTRQMIEKYVKSNKHEISIDFIQKQVSDYFGIPVDKINSKTRKREVVQARQLTMYFSKKYTKSSLSTIGLHCGNKDHATVLHACRTVSNLKDTDKQFYKYMDDIDKKIRG
jgi:chromosomal replication initiator protein